MVYIHTYPSPSDIPAARATIFCSKKEGETHIIVVHLNVSSSGPGPDLSTLAVYMYGCTSFYDKET